MPKLTKFTRTDETEKRYKKKAIELMKQARKELDIPSYAFLSLKQFVGWLCSGRSHLSKNGWKSYRAAVIYYIEHHIEDEEKEEVLDLLLSQKYDVLREKPEPLGPAKKMKKFPMKQFTQLVRYLNQEGEFKQPFIQSQYAQGLKFWLEAGMLTGLRPVEWAGAEYIDDNQNPRLLVKNAKNTNNRANGDKRTLLLKHLSESERGVIKEHVRRAKIFADIDQFHEYQKNCANLLSRAYKKLYPKSKEQPSLYSLRHQFAADAKATGYSTEEIAALMGHAVDDTATMHYAKKRSGKSACRIEPEPSEVLTVRKVLNNNKKKDISLDVERLKSLVLKK